MTFYSEKEASRYATLAVAADRGSDLTSALAYYQKAVVLLKEAREAGSHMPNMQHSIEAYDKRINVICTILKTEKENPSTTSMEGGHEVKKMLTQAFEMENKGDVEGAMKIYIEAAELCLKLRSEIKDENMLGKIESLASNAIERAEEIKRIHQSSSHLVLPSLPLFSPSSSSPSLAPPPSSSSAPPSSSSSHQRFKPLGFTLRSQSPYKASHERTSGGGGGEGGGDGGGYTKEELNVLRQTSNINGRYYVPFLKEDYRESFHYPLPYSDKDGLLSLSGKQRNNFGKWVRAGELTSDPKMVVQMSCYTIRQTIVSDCSLVASLAITAQYERKFKKKLISSIIYPQNKNGEPIFNSSGKYMVKLHLNGVVRKIIIDDYLPMSRDGQLLCSFSINPNEVWVSLLEKAYLKVMGGYDFPGSNSNIDLHSLTGWIPERISMKSSSFNPHREFTKIHDRFHSGCCLVTMATGDLAQSEADRAGLVPTHAYAMLDVQIVEGKQLFQLKNPWSHLRWKGNYSELDVTNWTESLKKKLHYNPKAASANDDGIFWIDYESLRTFFDVIYINWNPQMFSHTNCIHGTWLSKDGPKKDSYNMSDNPQFKLQVNNQSAHDAAVWVLLTRHIVDKDDFADNKEFITLLVYKSKGKRIYYPSDPPPYIDGVRINSPHYLIRMKVPPGDNLFTLVMSQYLKNNTINYTIRAYAACVFNLTKMRELYSAQFEKRVVGEWKGALAGGCRNNPTFQNNPVFQVKVDNNRGDNNLLIELKAPRSYNVGFEVATEVNYMPTNYGSFKVKDSGAFRPGYCCMELEKISGGIYNIQPSTFHPSQEASFFIEVSSSSPISLKRIS